MNEAQLLEVVEFQLLPIYDEQDGDSNKITSVVGSGCIYSRVRECATLDDVKACLRDSRLVPLGALRAGHDGHACVVAYFGERS